MALIPTLHQAIQERDLGAARLALEADLGQATTALPGGLSPLMFALYHEARDIVDLLRPFTEPNLFEAAALDDAERVARLLLADPPAARGFSPDGWTALHLAAFFGSRQACFVLIGLGCPLEVHAQNPTANTPLHAAIAGAAGEHLAPLLIALGARVDAVGADGVTALHLAAARGFEALCRLLVARGLDRPALTADGKTASDLARERGYPGLGSWLDGLGN
jgi:ankyrin repeat protein